MLETNKYVLTVEGETEKWYFLWLKDRINEIETKTKQVSIVAKVEQSPRSFYKGAIAKSTPEVIHICDVESAQNSDIVKFESILKEMKEAKKYKNINYLLGYSNLTFELWMILHKMDFYAPVNDKTKYLQPIQKAFDEKFEDFQYFKQEDTFKRCLNKLTIEDVKCAIKRAEKIARDNKKNSKVLVSHCNYSYYRENPSMSINDVVKKIIVECGIKI